MRVFCKPRESTRIIIIVRELICDFERPSSLQDVLDPDAVLDDDERAAFTLEAHTWSLLQALYSLRTSPPSTASLAESYYTPPLTLVQHAVASSPALSELSVVRDWLHSSAYSNLHPAEIRKGYHPYTRAKLKQAIRTGTTSTNPNISKLVSSLDPDATNRLSGQQRKVLDTEDATYEHAFLRSLYEYVRVGELDQAIDMCRQSDFSWRAASLSGGKLYQNDILARYALSANSETGLTPIQDMELDPDSRQRQGNLRRKLWKAMCRSMSSASHLDPYERALYAAVAGQIDPILPVCSTWEDHVWARVNGLLESEIDAILARAERDESNYFLSTFSGTSRQDDNQNNATSKPKSIPNSLKDIFDNLLKDQKVAMDARSPFHVAQAWLILDRAPDLLTSFVTRLERQQASESDALSEPQLAQLLRFFAHLVLFLRLIASQSESSLEEGATPLQPLPADASAAVLVAYVRVLQAHGKPPSLVAFYSSALDPSQAIECYASYLVSEFPATATIGGQEASERSARKQALVLAEENGIDLPAVARRAVDLTIADTLADHPDYDAIQASFGLLGPSSDSADGANRHQELVRSVEWLTFSVATYQDALIHANAMMRYFLCAGHPATARRIIYHIPPDLLPSSAQANYDIADEEVVKDNVNEYLDYISFFDVLQLHTQFSEVWAHRPPASARATERLQYTEALRTTVDAFYDAVIELLTAEWLVLPSDSDKRQDLPSQRRSLELSRIRTAYIPELVLRLHHALVDSGTGFLPQNIQRALNLANIVADERYRLYVEFMGDGHSAAKTQNRLKEYLSLVRDASLAALAISNDPFRIVQ